MEKWDPAKRLSFIAEKVKQQNEAQQRKGVDAWQGIAFVCHDEAFIVPLKQIVEIIPAPIVTVIPGAKPWFLGVTNLRGDLLPIVDLQYLFFSVKTSTEKYTPVLIIQHQDELSGILVNKLLGLYSLIKEGPLSFSLLSHSVFAPYIEAVIQPESEYFPVLDTHKLISDPIFSNIS